jgi:tRNA G10  N-methylase Trm11
MKSTNKKHPAKYSDSFIPIFADVLKNTNNVLDPMAGTGKISLIQDYGYSGNIYCHDILDWGELKHEDVKWKFGDASSLDYETNFFDAICTSPVYGNRMSDHFNSKDGSKRLTYRHGFGSELSKENTGRMQWGGRYREKHTDIYKDCKRVLKESGLFVINTSDHIRKGEVVPVTDWHEQTILNMGFVLIERVNIKTPRMGFGANSTARVGHEVISVFREGETII